MGSLLCDLKRFVLADAANLLAWATRNAPSGQDTRKNRPLRFTHYLPRTPHCVPFSLQQSPIHWLSAPLNPLNQGVYQLTRGDAIPLWRDLNLFATPPQGRGDLTPRLIA